MVLAASLALMAVSTVVAFQGWPGVYAKGSSDKADMLARVAAPAETKHTSSKAKASLTVPHRAPAPPPAVRKKPAAVAPKVAAVTASVAPARHTNGKINAQAHPAAQAANVASVVPARETTASTGKPAYKAGDPVRKVGNDLGGTVAGVGKGLGDTVAKISPKLGETVEKVTQAVGQVVAGATDAVGAVVDKLAHPPQQ